MKAKDFLTVLAAAGVTMALMFLAFGLRNPRTARAAGEAKAPTDQRQLKSQGCLFSLTTDRPSYAAGESPAVEIQASNPTSKAVDARVQIQMMGSAPMSPMARIVRPAQPLWSHELAIRLQPGETKTVKLPTGARLPAGQSISIRLTDKNTSIVAAEFPIPGDLAKDAQVLSVSPVRKAVP